MNVKLLFVIITLSFCFILRFEKISYGLTKEKNNNISELKVLTYLPKNNKSLFISKAKPPKIRNNIKKIIKQRTKIS